MKQKYWYFIEYWNDFGNTFNLWYAPAGTETPKGMERITRKAAEQKAAHERKARKEDPSFAYYGSAYIWPLDIPVSVARNEWLALDDNHTWLDRYNVHIISIPKYLLIE